MFLGSFLRRDDGEIVYWLPISFKYSVVRGGEIGWHWPYERHRNPTAKSDKLTNDVSDILALLPIPLHFLQHHPPVHPRAVRDNLEY